MKTIKHVVTQEDIDSNQFIQEENVPVGDTIEIGILDDQKEYVFLKDFGEEESGGLKAGDTMILPNAGWDVEDVDARIADGTIQIIDNEVVPDEIPPEEVIPEKKEDEVVPEKKAEEVIPEEDFFVTPLGIKLPSKIEGHKIQSVVDTLEINGVINYNCLCDDGCTYHTPSVA